MCGAVFDGVYIGKTVKFTRESEKKVGKIIGMSSDICGFYFLINYDENQFYTKNSESCTLVNSVNTD